MSGEQEVELRKWAELYRRVGLAQAPLILELLDEAQRLREQLQKEEVVRGE